MHGVPLWHVGIKPTITIALLQIYHFHPPWKYVITTYHRSSTVAYVSRSNFHLYNIFSEFTIMKIQI